MAAAVGRTRRPPSLCVQTAAAPSGQAGAYPLAAECVQVCIMRVCSVIPAVTTCHLRSETSNTVDVEEVECGAAGSSSERMRI
eukprot:7306742-Prymnesium_polylepis.1